MSGWINAKERLPKDGAIVITVFGGVVQHMLYYCDDATGEWYPTDDDCDPVPAGTFTHWTPLPEPPK